MGCQVKTKRESQGTDNLNRTRTSSLLTFEQYRCHQLLSLDVHFLVLELILHIVWAVKTAREFCSRELSCASLACRVVCSSDYALLAPKFSWLHSFNGLQWLQRLVMLVPQVLISPVLVSWTLQDCGIMMSLPSLALWVIIMAVPALSRMYTRYPTLRISILQARRFSKLLGALLSLAITSPQVVGLTFLHFMLTPAQYLFMCWQSAMTVVPLRVQLVSGFLEWLLTAVLIICVKKVYPATAALSSIMVTPAAMLLSFIAVYILPTAIMAAVEAHHGRGYRSYSNRMAWLQRPEAHADTGTGTCKDADAAVSSHTAYSSLCLAGAVRPVVSPFAADAQLVPGPEEPSSSPCRTPGIGCIALTATSANSAYGNSSNAGSDASEATAQLARRHSSSSTSSGSNSRDAASSAVSSDILVYGPSRALNGGASVMHRLESLLGNSAASNLLQVYEQSAAAAAPAAAGVYYTGSCRMNTAAIKVAAAHTDVVTLGPLLQSCLLTALAPGSSSSTGGKQDGVSDSICFPGCVQLLAHVVIPLPADSSQQGIEAAQLDNVISSNGSNGGVQGGIGAASDGGKYDAAAVHLFDLVHTALQSNLPAQGATVAAGDGPVSAISGSSAAAAAVPLVQVMWGEAYVSYMDEDRVAEQQLLDNSRAQLVAAAALAGHGSQSAERPGQLEGSSSSGPAANAVDSNGTSQHPPLSARGCIVSFSPACLTVGEPVALQVFIQGLTGNTASDTVRLLVFTAGRAVADRQMSVDVNGILEVDLPALDAGVLHVAVLPAEGSLQQQMQGLKGDSLLVLPAAAADEVQRLATDLADPSAAAAGVGADTAADTAADMLPWGNSGSETFAQQQTLIHQSLCALAIDVMYLTGEAHKHISRSSGSISAAPAREGGVSGCSRCASNEDSAFDFDGSDGGADSNVDGSLSGDAARVLHSVATFLLAHNCWHTLGYVLNAARADAVAVADSPADCTAAVVVATATAVDAAAAAATASTVGTPAQQLADGAYTARTAAAASNGSSRLLWRKDTAKEELHPPACTLAAKRCSSSSTAGQEPAVGVECDAAAAAGAYFARTSSSSSSSGVAFVAVSKATTKAGPAAAVVTAQHYPAVLEAAAAELAGSRWSIARQLVLGFRVSGLEASYLDSITQQAGVADFLAAIYYVVLAVSVIVLSGPLSSVWPPDWCGRVWEGASRVVLMMAVAVPSLLLVVFRRQLAAQRRREYAVLFCEWLLALLPLAGATGIILHGHTGLQLLANNKWGLQSVAFWCAGCYRAECRQVRTWWLLPPLLMQCAAAAFFAYSLGLDASVALVKYGGIAVAGNVCAALLEIRWRWSFLQQLSGRHAVTAAGWGSQG